MHGASTRRIVSRLESLGGLSHGLSTCFRLGRSDGERTHRGRVGDVQRIVLGSRAESPSRLRPRDHRGDRSRRRDSGGSSCVDFARRLLLLRIFRRDGDRIVRERPEIMSAAPREAGGRRFLIGKKSRLREIPLGWPRQPRVMSIRKRCARQRRLCARRVISLITQL